MEIVGGKVIHSKKVVALLYAVLFYVIVNKYEAADCVCSY